MCDARCCDSPDVQLAALTTETVKKIGPEGVKRASGLTAERVLQLIEFRAGRPIGRCSCCQKGETDGVKVSRCRTCGQAYCQWSSIRHQLIGQTARRPASASESKHADEGADRSRDWPQHKPDCRDWVRIDSMNREHNGPLARAHAALTIFIAQRRMTYDQVSRIAWSDRQPGPDEALHASSAGLTFIYDYREDREHDPIRVRSIVCQTAEELLRRPEFRGATDFASQQARARTKGHVRPILTSAILRVVVGGKVTETMATVGVQAVGVNVTGVAEERLKRGSFDLVAAFNNDAFSASAVKSYAAALGPGSAVWDIRGVIAAWGQCHRHILDKGAIRESTALDRAAHVQRSIILYVQVVFGTLEIARSFKPVRFVATSLARAHDRLGISGDYVDAQMERLMAVSTRGKLQQFVWVVLDGADKSFFPIGTVTDVHMFGAGAENMGEDDWRNAERIILESTRASSAGWFDDLKRACA